jgi:hypothetical protein
MTYRKTGFCFKATHYKKGQYKYYLKVWDENLGKYAAPRSAQSIALELDLDERQFPSTSRTGAIMSLPV